ncbi:MAG: hypothetical protein R2774_15255 [Saprospiraceae bacterium]
MKQVIILFLMGFISTIYGQKQIVWFDTGLKVQYGAAGLLNTAISNSDVYSPKIGTGLSYGGKIGINFAYNGIAIDVMKSSFSQDFNKGDNRYSTIDYNGLDIYVLFRNAKNLGYFEIGPKLSLVDKVTNTTDAEADVTADYESKNIAAVLGFGANILGNDGRFSGILGLRFEYGITDLGLKDNNTSPVNDVSIYADGYKASHPIFAGVVFELNWGIGYFGKAQCGGRSKFIMF